MPIKTFKAWDESGLDLDKFINPLDEVDGDLYDHMCGIVSPHFSDRNCFQVGEPMSIDNGIYYHETFIKNNGKYFYVGVLPAFANE